MEVCVVYYIVLGAGLRTGFTVTFEKQGWGWARGWILRLGQEVISGHAGFALVVNNMYWFRELRVHGSFGPEDSLKRI